MHHGLQPLLHASTSASTAATGVPNGSSLAFPQLRNLQPNQHNQQQNHQQHHQQYQPQHLLIQQQQQQQQSNNSSQAMHHMHINAGPHTLVALGQHSSSSVGGHILLDMQTSSALPSSKCPSNINNNSNNNNDSNESNSNIVGGARSAKALSSNRLGTVTATSKASKKSAATASAAAAATSAVAKAATVVRYNRRNNPELEKRRIHHCDFLGKSSLVVGRTASM